MNRLVRSANLQWPLEREASESTWTVHDLVGAGDGSLHTRAILLGVKKQAYASLARVFVEPTWLEKVCLLPRTPDRTRGNQVHIVSTPYRKLPSSSPTVLQLAGQQPARNI